jgi:hypothetical protein
MAGISNVGSVRLPSAQDLFAGTSATTPAATSAPVTGPVVAGPGGSTQLPSAAPTDFGGTNPTPLDTPHPQYGALTSSHVAVLQAIGTPEALIQQINAAQPQAEYIERYIQGEIFQNPEGWDDVVGNPAGTARAGLQRLAPGIQLPAPGRGTPGYLPDGSPVSGIQIPGVSTPVTAGPLLDPTTGSPQAPSEGEGLLKGAVILGAIAGVGYLAYRFLKGRGGGGGGAGEVGDATRKLLGGGGEGLAGAAAGLDDLISRVGSKGASGAADLADLRKITSLTTILGGGVGGVGGTGAVHTAATLDSVLRGQGVANGFLNSIGASAAALNMPVRDAAELALSERVVGVLEQLARNGGTVADLAAARALTAQLGGAVGQAAGSASQLSGLRQTLLNAAMSIV